MLAYHVVSNDGEYPCCIVQCQKITKGLYDSTIHVTNIKFISTPAMEGIDYISQGNRSVAYLEM